jgi:hypothetical protein
MLLAFLYVCCLDIQLRIEILRPEAGLPVSTLGFVNAWYLH